MKGGWTEMYFWLLRCKKNGPKKRAQNGLKWAGKAKPKSKIRFLHNQHFLGAFCSLNCLVPSSTSSRTKFQPWDPKIKKFIHSWFSIHSSFTKNLGAGLFWRDFWRRFLGAFFFGMFAEKRAGGDLILGRVLQLGRGWRKYPLTVIFR